ncbi:hypothetical protein BDV40DRAFT_61317 [Aspergillus tamarii]|uniref:Uncharacterized protein n=1 Tax=Aspergillus tamarii TaxID=41984 RepID=A0A5N6UEJ1_ASPTM|nr:hypothetical protein BDV40DRAFT_61317 [Aspergillus tamarii]
MNVYSAVTKPYLGHMMLMDTFPFPGNAEVRTFFPPSVLAVRNLSPRILYQLNITGGPFSWLIIIYCHLSHDDLQRTAAFDMACSHEGSIYLTSWGTCIHLGLRRCYIHKCRTICGQWMCGIGRRNGPLILRPLTSMTPKIGSSHLLRSTAPPGQVYRIKVLDTRGYPYLYPHLRTEQSKSIRLHCS